jgi:hypothetical protein
MNINKSTIRDILFLVAGVFAIVIYFSDSPPYEAYFGNALVTIVFVTYLLVRVAGWVVKTLKTKKQ